VKFNGLRQFLYRFLTNLFEVRELGVQVRLAQGISRQAIGRLVSRRAGSQLGTEKRANQPASEPTFAELGIRNSTNFNKFVKLCMRSVTNLHKLVKFALHNFEEFVCKVEHSFTSL
jgi:hypothetical protein